MIKIITISGVLYIHEEDIRAVFKKNGAYYMTTVHGSWFEKWEITQESFNFLSDWR